MMITKLTCKSFQLILRYYIIMGRLWGELVFLSDVRKWKQKLGYQGKWNWTHCKYISTSWTFSLFITLWTQTSTYFIWYSTANLPRHGCLFELAFWARRSLVWEAGKVLMLTVCWKTKCQTQSQSERMIFLNKKLIRVDLFLFFNFTVMHYSLLPTIPYYY